MDFLNDATYVDQAEKVILDLKNQTDNRGKPVQMVTTSKIRNILSMAADIYDNAMQSNSNELNADVASRIEYLRVRMIYEAGRERSVKDFVEKSHLLDYCKMIGADKKRYIMFYRYLEALIAFHKFNGGKEN